MAARLGGRYELGAVLGSGGMARVYAATDLVLGRQVAVKVLDPALARDPEFLARFGREARTAAMLPTHAGIVTIFDSGQDAGAAYLVMELVTGRTLAQTISSYGRFQTSVACRIALEVCQALVVAHGAGLVHRDIKPANIMLTNSDAVKVVDFGIARTQAADGLTRTGAVLGSPSYMAPEQITGAAVDARTDLYALGTVLYEMLTGAAPFVSEDSFAVLSRHLNEVPRPPSAINPEVPSEVDRIVAALLAKSPAQRPASAEQVAQMLAPAAGAPARDRTTVAMNPHEANRTRQMTPMVLPASAGGIGAGSGAGAGAVEPRRRRGLLAGYALIFAAVAAAVIYTMLPGSGNAPAATTGTTSSQSGSAQASAGATTPSASPSATDSATDTATDTSSPTSSPTDPASAVSALEQTISAEANSGDLDGNAQQDLENGVQNMQQTISDSNQNSDGTTQLSADARRRLKDEIANMRQLVSNDLQNGDASQNAATAIDNALNVLRQTLN
ncbi:MAG TPA: protein kinase [Actinospica sp.]|nr:protein kinase [Actinospica sp.]